jgi:hypothetical protein
MGKTRKLPKLNPTDDIETGTYVLDEPMRPIRDVAMMLGIGRTRVVQQEQSALQKLRSTLAAVGVTALSSLDDVSFDRLETLLRPIQEEVAKKRQPMPYDPRQGWLPVTAIRSLNGGTEAPEEVARAYQFLKRSHQDEVRPPLLISLPRGTCSLFRIEAAGVYANKLQLRCWPKRTDKFAVSNFTQYCCTAIVDSEFAVDAQGEFDVPVLVCAIVSARKPNGNSGPQR